jgi:hypothetical protein
MSNFKRRGSYSYLTIEDDETEEKILEKLNSSYSRTKWTDRICFLINYCSLIITLIYNSYWIYIFQKFLPKIEEEQTKNCPVIMNWNNYYSTWVIISLLKAVFLLLFAPMGVGSEFDCNFFLLALKMLSSVIPCVFFILFIPYHGINIYNELKDGDCFKLYENLTLFYQWEKTYFIFIVCVLFSPVIGGLGMALKEYIKCLKEKND